MTLPVVVLALMLSVYCGMKKQGVLDKKDVSPEQVFNSEKLIETQVQETY